MDRRNFFANALKAAGGVVAAGVLVPLGIYSLSPVIEASPEEDWQPVGKLSNFPMNKVVAANLVIAKNAGGLNKKGVFVWRKNETDTVVYSRSCTDLGCPLTYDSGSEWFYCPCHGGIFDKEGERRAGPPKEPMWRYKTRIREDILEVDVLSIPPMA